MGVLQALPAYFGSHKEGLVALILVRRLPWTYHRQQETIKRA